MAKMHLDFLVLETFDRLFGVSALLDVLDESISDMEWREREALRQMAEAGNWDLSDYTVELQVLDEKFRHWTPTFAAYAVLSSSRLWKTSSWPVPNGLAKYTVANFR